MSFINIFSLTTLNRNTAVLRTGVTAQRVVVLTQHGRASLAVVQVELLQQLLTIAEQAAALLQQPDIRQLTHVVTQFENTSLLADRATLAAQLAELNQAITGESST
jgi:hypothetical protein